MTIKEKPRFVVVVLVMSFLLSVDAVFAEDENIEQMVNNARALRGKFLSWS